MWLFLIVGSFDQQAATALDAAIKAQAVPDLAAKVGVREERTPAPVVVKREQSPPAKATTQTPAPVYYYQAYQQPAYQPAYYQPSYYSAPSYGFSGGMSSGGGGGC